MNIDGSTPLNSANINNQASIIIEGNTVPLKGEITITNLNSKAITLEIYLSSLIFILIIIN